MAVDKASSPSRCQRDGVDDVESRLEHGLVDPEALKHEVSIPLKHRVLHMVEERWRLGICWWWSREHMFDVFPRSLFSSHRGEKVGVCLSRSCHDYRFFETIKYEPLQFHQKPILFLELF